MSASVEPSSVGAPIVRGLPLTQAQRSLLGVVGGAFVALGLQEGAAGALWPDVIDAFDVSKGAFGLASGVGLTLGFPIFILGGRITSLWDKRLLLAISFLILGISMVAITAGAGVAALIGVLGLRGLGICLLELSANSMAMEIEQASRRHLMSAIHSGYSGGLVSGAGLAWIVLELGLGFRWVFVILAVLIAGLLLAAIRQWKMGEPAAPRSSDRGGGLAFGLFRRADIRLIALICAVSFCGELLIAQWITIYLRDERGYSASVGVIAVVLLGVTMFIGRVVNVGVTNSMGAQRALLLQGIILTLGGGLLIATQSAVMIVLGCAVAGLGLAGIAPTGLSLAGKLVPEAPGQATGAAMIGGYAALAVMPFVAGIVATAMSVRTVLTIELAFGAIVIGSAVWLRRIESTQPTVPA